MVQKVRWSFEADTKKFTGSLDLASQFSNKLGLEVKDLGSMLNDFYKTEKKIGSYTKLNDQLEQSSKKYELSRKKLEDLEKAFKKVDTPTVAMVKDLYNAKEKTSQLEVKVASLTTKTGDLRRELTDENIDLNNLSESTRRLADEKKRLTGVIDNQMSVQKRAKAKTDRKSNFKDSANAMANVGTAAKSWGTGVLESAYSPMSTFIEFQARRSKLAAKVLHDKSKEEREQFIKELELQAMELGGSTSYKASQVLDAQIVMGAGGASKDDIKAGMADIIAIAKATDVSLADAVGVSQGVMNQFSEQFKGGYSDINKIGDILVATTNSAKLELNELKETFKNTGLVAASFGADLETTSALIQTLAMNSQTGGEAGTHLKILFNRLRTMPAETKKALNLLKVRVSENGRMRDIKDILGDVAKSIDKYDEKKKGMIAKNIAGSDAVGSLLAVLKEANKEIRNEDGTISHINNLNTMADAYRRASDNGGIAAKMMGIMSDNTQKNLDDLGAKWENLSLKVGASMEEPLNFLVDTLEVGITSMSDFIDGNEEWAQALMVGTLGLGGLAAAAGALLVPLGALALTAGPAFAAIGTALEFVTVGAAALGGATALGGAAIAPFGAFGSLWDWVTGAEEKSKPGLFETEKIRAEEQAKMSLKPDQELSSNIKNISQSRSVKVDSQIVINPLPGMDVKDIGKAVRDEIENLAFNNKMGLMADT